MLTAFFKIQKKITQKKHKSKNQSIMSAENYQLKWNSHVTNLNSSISSLYKNDKYADVLLFTCNSEEGYSGIPAHKLILGTCSHVR